MPELLIDAAWNRKHNACYGDRQLEALYDRPHTILEVLTRRDGDWATVSDRDRVWVLTRVGVMSRDQTNEWLEMLVARSKKYVTAAAAYAAARAAAYAADAAAATYAAARAAAAAERSQQVVDAIEILGD